MQNRVMTCKCGHATITPSLCMSGSRTQRQVHFQPTYSHFTSRILSNSCPLMQQRQQKRTHTSKGQPAQTTAMINVDGSPPLFLGAGMIAAGAVLYQLRNSRPYITKDFDIVLSCIAIFAGGILVFQGWRLDPILLFGQLLTAGAALSFAVEALRLREVVHKKELSEAADYERQAMDPRYDTQNPEALSLPARWDSNSRMQADAQSSQPWWEEQQPAYRSTQYEQNRDTPESSMQSRMDSQIPSDSVDRQRNMASSSSATGSIPSSWQGQPNRSPQGWASPKDGNRQKQHQQKWGSDIDLGSLEEWDSD